MEIDQQRINIVAQLHAGLYLIRSGKGIGIFRHKQIGHDIDHPQPQTSFILNDSLAVTRQPLSHVYRPDQVWLAGHIRRYFCLIKHMIAGGQHINAAGEQVFTQVLEGSQSSVDVSGWPAGMYVVRLGQQVRRLVVQ